MLRLPSRWTHALAILLLVGLPATSSALPIAYHSAADDGTSSGIALIPDDSSSRDLALWFDAGELSYGFLLTLKADPGLELISFAPEPGIVASGGLNFFPGDGGALAIQGGDFASGDTAPVRLGSLKLAATLSGSELRLEPVDFAVPPVFVDASFVNVSIPIQVIARASTASIPEPPLPWLVMISLLVLAAHPRSPASPESGDCRPASARPSSSCGDETVRRHA